MSLDLKSFIVLDFYFKVLFVYLFIYLLTYLLYNFQLAAKAPFLISIKVFFLYILYI